MNKKILLIIVTVSLLLAGCSNKVTQTNTAKQNMQSSPSATTNTNKTAAAATITTSDAIDYNQYIKKTWVKKNGSYNTSICISNIANGRITGYLDSGGGGVHSSYDLQNLTGTINKDTAECQFSDTIGNKGNIKLVLKPNDEIETTIKLTSKAQAVDQRPQEGTFDFIPYNLSSIKGFSLIKDQSFMVNLNLWGNVRFVSGKLTAGNHVPVVFYLTDKEGNILYDFADAPFPYSVDVKAVSLVDVNKDGLKDIIIIVADDYKGSDSFGKPIAAVFLQNTKGLFSIDLNLYQEINTSGNNKDVKTITNYLSKKF